MGWLGADETPREAKGTQVQNGDQESGSVPVDFRAFAEQANEGMLVLDADRRITFANQAIRDLMGVGDEVIGRDIVEFLDMSSARKVESEFDRRREGVRSHYEVEIPWAEGAPRTLHVAASPQLGPDGKFCGTFAIVNDITEKIALEQQLQEYAQNLEEMVQARTNALIASEQRYHEVFANVTEGIVRVDRQGTILLCNSAFAEMVGSTSGEIMGRNMMRLVHEDDVNIVVDASERLVRGEPIARTRIFRMRRLDDREIVYIETTASVTHREDAIDSIQILARDVTERVLAEEELKRAYAELKGLSRAKTNFLSNITHELKTPLVTVRGYTQMLHGGNLGPVTDQQRTALSTSLRNVDVLLAQIERLLSVSRLELSDAGLHLEAVPVADFLRDCGAETLLLAEQKRVDLRLGAVPADLPPLHADWEKLADALAHLIGNGIKFTGPGGVVELSAARDGADAIRLNVHDTGAGLDPERVAKLFEPFEQADGTHTRDYEGLGIGLALVRRIVELHGGQLGVDSTPGAGSTFWCRIPTSTETPLARTGRPRVDRTAGLDVQGVPEPAGAEEEEELDDLDDDLDPADIDLDDREEEPIVFVDHDLDMLRFLRQAFEDANLPVDTIMDPEAVLPQIRTTGARVVFVDVGFPQADGVELCRQLKRDPVTAGIPVYVFTGHNGRDVRARAEAAGADGFITKPVSLDYLLEVAGRHR